MSRTRKILSGIAFVLVGIGIALYLIVMKVLEDKFIAR